MRRRLSESARALVESDRKIIDIAFQYQFNSHEGFSRTFKKMFAVQPNQWRKSSTIEGRQLMPRLTRAHIHHLHKGSYLEPTYREHAEFKVSGVMGLVKGKSNIIQDLWDIIVQVIRGQPEAERPDTFFGISTPTGEGIKGYFYVAAFEQHARQIRNLKLVSKTIPAMTCAIFIHKGNHADLHLTLDYIYHTWLPNSGLGLSHALQIERFGREMIVSDQTPDEWEIWIPVLPTR
jgi:AraC family transcriptional regulator